MNALIVDEVDVGEWNILNHSRKDVRIVMQRWRMHMTYYEKYSKLQSEEELKDWMKRDTYAAVVLGNNPDRIKAIEDAGNRVAKEKGWNDEH